MCDHYFTDYESQEDTDTEGSDDDEYLESRPCGEKVSKSKTSEV